MTYTMPYELLTLIVSNSHVLKHRLDHSKESVNLFPPPPNQVGGPPFIGCLRIFILYSPTFPSYLEAVPSVRNLRTRHAFVTGNLLSWHAFKKR